MEQELEDKLVQALLEAERTCREFLERSLGSKASRINITLKLDVRNGVKTLTVDIEAARRGVDDINYIVEAAVELAFKTFEEKSGLKVFKGGRGRG